MGDQMMGQHYAYRQQQMMQGTMHAQVPVMQQQAPQEQQPVDMTALESLVSSAISTTMDPLKLEMKDLKDKLEKDRSRSRTKSHKRAENSKDRRGKKNGKKGPDNVADDDVDIEIRNLGISPASSEGDSED